MNRTCSYEIFCSNKKLFNSFCHKLNPLFFYLLSMFKKSNTSNKWFQFIPRTQLNFPFVWKSWHIQHTYELTWTNKIIGLLLMWVVGLDVQVLELGFILALTWYIFKKKCDFLNNQINTISFFKNDLTFKWHHIDYDV